MRTIAEIRHAQLTTLIQETGGVGAVAEKLGVSQPQVSHWNAKSKHSATGKPRGMSDETARRLEVAFNKERGWMDNDPLFATEAERRLVELFRLMSPNLQNRLINEAIFLAGLGIPDPPPTPNPIGSSRSSPSPAPR